jgi:hypothetical protein
VAQALVDKVLLVALVDGTAVMINAQAEVVAHPP